MGDRLMGQDPGFTLANARYPRLEGVVIGHRHEARELSVSADPVKVMGFAEGRLSIGCDVRLQLSRLRSLWFTQGAMKAPPRGEVGGAPERVSDGRS